MRIPTVIVPTSKVVSCNKLAKNPAESSGQVPVRLAVVCGFYDAKPGFKRLRFNTLQERGPVLFFLK